MRVPVHAIVWFAMLSNANDSGSSIIVADTQGALQAAPQQSVPTIIKTDTKDVKVSQSASAAQSATAPAPSAAASPETKIDTTGRPKFRLSYAAKLNVKPRVLTAVDMIETYTANEIKFHSDVRVGNITLCHMRPNLLKKPDVAFEKSTFCIGEDKYGWTIDKSDNRATDSHSYHVLDINPKVGGVYVQIAGKEGVWYLVKPPAARGERWFY